MKNYAFILTLFAFLFSGCSETLPENYGIYAYSGNGRVTLTAQKLNFTGNLFQSIVGLRKPSGNGFSKLKNIIVFEKNVDPKYIRLSRLEFKKSAVVDNIFSKSTVAVNLWAAAKNIEFDVAPIDGKKDMYRLTPKTAMTEGFYALHFGGLENQSTIEASMGSMAYDFVIGNVDDYRSGEEKLTREANALLKTMNQYYNTKTYDKIKEIYRPNGKAFAEQEWQDFTKGLATYYNTAGSIKDSKIIGADVSDGRGVFELQTTYENKAPQHEKLIVEKIENKYFITSLE